MILVKKNYPKITTCRETCGTICPLVSKIAVFVEQNKGFFHKFGCETAQLQSCTHVTLACRS